MDVLIRALLLIMAVPLLALLAGCGSAVSPTDQNLIREAEVLHRRLAPALLETRNPSLERYFKRLGSRIIASAREAARQNAIRAGGDGNGPAPGSGANDWMFADDMAFHLVDSPLPNAFTAGGKHVYVYEGLFARCRSEDELAAALCRQFAHVFGRHVQQVVQRDGSDSDEGVLRQFASLLYAPSHPRDADAIGFAIYARAGWDPVRFAALDQRMLEAPAADRVDPVLVRERVAQARRAAETLPPAAGEWVQSPVADESAFAQLQAGAREVAGRTPAGETAALLLVTFPSAFHPADTPEQAEARRRLFPPALAPSENKWGKGAPGT